MQADTTKQTLIERPIQVVQEFYKQKASKSGDKEVEVSSFLVIYRVQLRKLLQEGNSGFVEYAENLLEIHGQEVPNLEVSLLENLTMALGLTAFESMLFS